MLLKILDIQFSERDYVHACVYAASVHSWWSGTVCVPHTQVQLLSSPVAVISELRGIISSLQLS